MNPSNYRTNHVWAGFFHQQYSIPNTGTIWGRCRNANAQLTSAAYAMWNGQLLTPISTHLIAGLFLAARTDPVDWSCELCKAMCSIQMTGFRVRLIIIRKTVERSPCPTVGLWSEVWMATLCNGGLVIATNDQLTKWWVDDHKHLRRLSYEWLAIWICNDFLTRWCLIIVAINFYGTVHGRCWLSHVGSWQSANEYTVISGWLRIMCD